MTNPVNARTYELRIDDVAMHITAKHACVSAPMHPATLITTFRRKVKLNKIFDQATIDILAAARNTAAVWLAARFTDPDALDASEDVE